MATRNMIAANEKIFRELDRFCADRGDLIKNAGAARWIATAPQERRLLKNAVVVAQLSLGPSIKLAHYEFDKKSYLVASGLDIGSPPAFLTPEDLTGSILTLFLAEESPSPSRSAAEIRNIVEFSDKDADPKFAGFAPEDIESLFPRIQAFSTETLDLGESYKSFFLLALCSKLILQMRDDQLVKTIRSLTELSSQAIPYRTLCRSILDMDPSSVFLALYRCMEALYAYSHAESLRNALKLKIVWSELARTLEEVLDWRPREEPSLGAILALASKDNLERAAASFGESIPADVVLHNFVAKRIYNLRNSVVHYRPFQQVLDEKPIDWSGITRNLAVLIFDIYDRMFTEAGGPPIP